ncbi:MAG TPA: 2-C-methyl-D-erythritol 2,4-cyclodiphosphate synthase [Candidatus Eubacterium faecipullorum]|uniref:2-C-methyl-D-erythritol 2,4-cyclodiphosphate synthase n=1 Tax=Candidatus Eubacterium faecipullorum TaxID=2838571 RepID=A0A9D1RGD6_9FIRM|nr:2-C-methyl-D-erythritol 2,4-cyclodiphosphate synthase [Candidatus Eubacterium faecipullorum]
MSNIRIGHGYDVHRFEKGRKCIIGGVDIPSELGLLGHSDADVLLHAVADSLFGAASLGDIGKHFPDTSPEFEGADSLELLRKTTAILKENGYAVSNIDSTVVAQAPKMAPYIDAMRKNIAVACNISMDCVSVKATTEEKLGFTGNMQGISAHAVCLIEKI